MELLAIGIIGIFAAIAILYQGKLIGELRKDLSYKGNKLADSLSEWKDKFNTEKDKLEKLLNELGYGYADRKAPAGILCWGGGTVKEIQPKDYCVITDLGKRIKDQSNGMKYLAEIINKFEVELNTLKDHTHTVTVKKYSSNRALLTWTWIISVLFSSDVMASLLKIN